MQTFMYKYHVRVSITRAVGVQATEDKIGKGN